MAKSSPKKRSRWTVGQARAVLDQQERSGLSVQRFAERESLDAERLYRWRRKLNRGGGPVGFVEVRADTGAPLEIVLRSGHRLLIRGAADVATLRAIVTTLEREC